MATHVVKKRENLSAIARQYGYSDWKALFNHPANAVFRKKRPNPNLVFPGDVLVIPDKPAAVQKAALAPRSDEDFQSIVYNLGYRSEGGRLSKYLKATYPDGSEKDIHLDSITPTQPRLWEAKKQAVKIMDDYNATFILGGAFPVVFQILTIGTSLTPVTELPGVYNEGFPKRVIPKPSASSEILESEGAIKPGTATRTHIDPFTGETHPIMATAKTERSLVTSIRADVAESDAYKVALFERREIGIQRPTGANVQGSDFITAVVAPGTKKIQIVLANDVKASVAGKFPVPKTTIPGSWRTEIQNAVAPGRLKLGDPVLEAEIRRAVQEGRLRLRQLNVNYSVQGQGQITGW
jgi:hypothetical protein